MKIIAFYLANSKTVKLTCPTHGEIGEIVQKIGSKNELIGDLDIDTTTVCNECQGKKFEFKTMEGM